MSAAAVVWRNATLADLSRPDGLFTDGDWIESRDQDPSGSVRLIQLADIGVGEFLDRSNRWITEATARRLKCTFLKPGDLLIARMPDPVGRACELRDLGYPCVTAVDVSILRVPADVNRSWALEQINSDRFRKEVAARLGGTTRARISRGNLGTIQLKVPTLHEQEAIARLADAFGALGRIVEKLIASKRAFKRALLHELLTGRRRFPEFSDSGAWQSVTLGDLVESVNRKNANGASERVLTCSGEHGLVDQRQFFSKLVAGESRDGYVQLLRGEFAYNRSSMSGYPYGAIKRLDRYDSGVVSTLNICFGLSSDACTSDFLLHLFESGLLNQHLARIARVGSRAHGLLNVTKSEFFQTQVLLPSVAEQERITLVLNALDHELKLLDELHDALQAQRRALMQRLLSGDLPLPSGAAKTDTAHD